ncbi:MAG: 3-hydroxyacyl-ACP dehydratase [Fluviicola sp.]|nr:MAG: 3-hydroxyacyl-ACP dehydratase [Fluviicola sp.]
MLLENFYKVEKIDNLDSNKYEAYIHLNKGHDIFKGHFPNNPITPGVCMVQIIKDLTSQVKGVNLSLISSNNIKFMAVINPVNNPGLRLSLELKDNEDGTISVKNITYFDETVALKMSAIYKIK